MEIIRRVVPYDSADALCMIGQVFGQSEADLERCQLNGSECAQNLDIVYEARENGRLLGIIHATVPKQTPSLGGLSAMCTDPQARGTGLGRRLFEKMVQELDASGVETAFLGTGNPIAAKLYRSTGFSYLAGSGIMARCKNADITDFVKRTYQAAPAKIQILPGSPAMRIPIIPLIALGGTQKVLDLNTRIFSTSFAMQGSCMGLYPRYQALEEKGGAYWVAVNEQGIPGAALSVLPTQAGSRMDFFCSTHFEDALPGLYEQAREHFGDLYMQIAKSDHLKQAQAERLGFTKESDAAAMTDCGSFFLPFYTYR